MRGKDTGEDGGEEFRKSRKKGESGRGRKGRGDEGCVCMRKREKVMNFWSPLA